jgi:ADP-heptose:LPS heptosyltransferase
MRRILILRGGALGDFIVTLPALAALRAAYPAAVIELAGNAPAAALAVDRGLLDVAYSQNEARWSALCSSSPLPPDFAKWLGTFDLILNFWPDPDATLARHIQNLSVPIFRTSSAHPTRAPAAAHYCEPLRTLGLPITDFFYPLLTRADAQPFRGSDLSAINPQLLASSPIALHPGSGSPKKNWPLSRWLELAAWLRSTHAPDLLIITGEAEDPATRAALAPFGTSVHALPLEDLITRLKSCRFFIGHDSGIGHLAAACGVPSLFLFGPTDPAIWAPPAEHVTVLRRSTSLGSVSLPDVQSALRPFLGG